MSEKHNILFVDDEESILSSLKHLFRKEEYTIFTANSGKKGLEILNENLISLIITDYRMSEMNGVQFLQEAQKISSESIRMILSGYADISAILDSINKGEIYKYLSKPWEDKDLKLTVRRAIEQYETTKQNKMLFQEIQEKNIELSSLNKQLSKNLTSRTQDLQFSQAILSHLPLPVIGISYEGLIVSINIAAQKIFGEENLYIIGMPPKNVFSKECAEEIKNVMQMDDATALSSYSYVHGGKKYNVIGYLLGDDTQKRGLVLVFYYNQQRR